MDDVARQAVIDAAAAGETWAWTSLHGALTPGLVGYAAAVGAADPDGIVGEALTRLGRDLAGVTATPEDARLWAFLHARAVLHERRELAVDAGRSAPSTVPPTVRVALSTLGTRQREALVLRVVAGLDEDDVATVLGDTPEAVRRLVLTAMRALQTAAG